MSEELRSEQQLTISLQRVKKTLESQVHELAVSFMFDSCNSVMCFDARTEVKQVL